jgi:hypothetical protein
MEAVIRLSHQANGPYQRHSGAQSSASARDLFDVDRPRPCEKVRLSYDIAS